MSKDIYLDFNYFQNIKKKLFSIEKGLAVVSGGCGRVGSIFTNIFISNDIKVLILSRNKKKFLNFKSKLPKNKQKNIFWKQTDLTNAKSIQNVCNFLKKKKILYLINNASFSYRGSFFDYNLNKINKEMWGVFNGNMLLTEKVLFQMRKQNKGKIIFTGSLWGIKSPKFEIYKELDNGPTAIIAAGKAGVNQYVKFLAAREAKFNITINTLTPGWFPRKGKVENKRYIKKIKNTIPLNKIGKLENLITTINFLLLNGSNYVTGQNILVDGGYSVH
jgi:short-subunit dehydrogenase